MMQRHRLRWYEHALRNDDNDYVKKCIDYEVEGIRPGERLWKKPVESDN